MKRKYKIKRLFLFLLAVVLLCALSGEAFAEKALLSSPEAAGESSAWLQGQIDNATDDVPTTITLTADIEVDEVITIPSGKNIILIPDSTARTLRPVAANDSPQIFYIEDGAQLTLGVRDGDDAKLVLDGNGKKLGYGMILCEGTLILESGTLKGFAGIASRKGAVAVSGQNASFTMNGGLITENTFYNQYGGIVYVYEGATFTMNGGVISQNDAAAPEEEVRDINNGVIYIEASGTTDISAPLTTTFILEGGEISNNHSHSGTVFLGEPAWPDYYSKAKMTMNGGLITQNTAMHIGGGVFVCGQAIFEMNDGTISHNTAMIGAGVAAYDLYVSYGEGQSFEDWKYFFPGQFTLNGGEISNNHAVHDEDLTENDGGCGGGVYVGSDNVVLNAGHIINNTASKQGGGVYVGSIPYTLHMYNALITENTANVLGGGMWYCPTGDSTNTVTSGGAIFDNTADGAGDDYAAVWQPDREHYTSLADRMLGGGEVKWYLDGAVDSNVQPLGDVDDSVARFDPANPGQRITNIQNSADSYALKSLANESAKQLARDKATLIITGNSSERGGGVGANGAVIIGVPGEDYTLNVTKTWSSDTPENEKKELTVYLKIDDYELDAVVLNSTSNWRAQFTQLPNPASLDMKIAVVENPVPDGFIPSYSDVVIDTDTQTMNIEITNTYIPPKSLCISKTVTGNGDQEKDFTFTVKLKNADGSPLQGAFSYTGNRTGTISDGGEILLKHGQSIVTEPLPSGTLYEVIEQDSEDYTVTSSNSKGVITENQAAMVSFINHKTTPGSETTSVSVNKIWDDQNNANQKRPNAVKVQLCKDGVAYGDPVSLNEGTQWAYTWSDLSIDSLWTVQEIEIPDGYQAKITQDQTNFTITNTLSLSPAPTPAPPTGDRAKLTLWISLMGIAATGFIIALFAKKRKQNTIK